MTSVNDLFIRVKINKITESISHKLNHLTSYKRILSSDNLILNNEQCSICLNTYQKNEYKREMDICKHRFHKKCIDKWLVGNSMTCPLCKQNYNINKKSDS
jgi:hypothetical protein